MKIEKVNQVHKAIAKSKNSVLISSTKGTLQTPQHFFLTINTETPNKGSKVLRARLVKIRCRKSFLY